MIEMSTAILRDPRNLVGNHKVPVTLIDNYFIRFLTVGSVASAQIWYPFAVG